MNPSRRSTDELLRARIARATKLQAQIKNLEARKRGEDRRRATRRTFLVGDVVIAEAERNPDFAATLRTILDSAVHREADRTLLGNLLSGPLDDDIPF